ncbi:MAG: tryptophan--tRNA ligase [Nanoarchaeota archaeon]|nr:tryptophan--tRNA ligase [Nanoarchaeota archaeon]MBU4116538.1 tryptophan--tRNA ligase [Nanoarchaeota archaeon]
MIKKASKVTPWEVEGKVDYDKLIKEFGVSRLDDKLLERIKKHAKDLHPMLRRKIFFAHRDLKWLLDEYDKGNKFFLYTGCGPSGPIHLGHLGTWVFTKWLQDVFDVELYFQFTDDEKFLFKDKSYDEIQKWTYDNMLDVIALGFNPKKTFFIVDTKHANLMYPEAIKVAKKITYSTVKAAFGFDDSKNIGEIFYTSMQAVPVFLPCVLKKRKIPCLIPLAIDQDPHFRIARDVYPKLGYDKPAIIHSIFLPPLTGTEGKMSSSNSDKAILTTDSPNQVKKKINKYAFSGGQASIEEHRKKGGNPDVDVSFQYLKFFFEQDDAKLQQIYDDYKSGKMLTSELKNYLIDKINAFLKEHQKKRELAKKQINDFMLKN